jgi:integrase
LARRDNGEGTVYRNKKAGYWEGQLPLDLRNILPPQPGSRAKHQNFAYDPDKRACRAKLNELIREAEAARKSRIRTPDNYTVQRCVEDWLDANPDKLDDQTLAKYRRQAEIWVYPRIGPRLLADVTPLLLRSVLDQAAPHLGAWSLQNIRSTLRRAIRLAQVNLLIDHNDAELLDLPAPGKDPQPVEALNRDDVSKVMQEVAGTRDHALFAISIYLGLRPGEITELRWDHVVLEPCNISCEEECYVHRVIYVWRSTSKGGATKTPQSKRTLRIPDLALGPLADWRMLQELEREAAGECWQDHGMVFCHPDGRAYTRHVLRHTYEKVTRRVGLGALPPYAGRHTFVSVLFDAGIPTERIAPLVGHANSGVTETVYKHLITPVLRDAARAIDAAFTR